MDVLFQLGTVGFVLALLGATVYLLRRMGLVSGGGLPARPPAGPGGARPEPLLAVLESRRLSASCELRVIRFEDSVLLIALGPQGARLISEHRRPGPDRQDPAKES